jgi:transposase
MKRFVEGIDRSCCFRSVEDWIDGDNPVRVIDAFVDKLDLSVLGFEGVPPEATGRPSYHPSVLLKLYISGY